MFGAFDTESLQPIMDKIETCDNDVGKEVNIVERECEPPTSLFISVYILTDSFAREGQRLGSGEIIGRLLFCVLFNFG